MDIVKTLKWFMGDVVQVEPNEGGDELLLTKGTVTLAITIPEVRGVWCVETPPDGDNSDKPTTD